MSKKNAVVLSPMNSVLAEFGNYYATELSKEYVDLEQRPDRLRVSGFPFCGLESAYKLMVKDETIRKAGFGSKYYTGVGTLTHEIVQDMVGMGGRILGQWNCLTPNCKGVRLLSRKNKCPICKGLMRYEELTVSAFKYVSGHLDGIYKTKDGEYFVVDYKTSSVRVIESQHERRTLPYHHNVCQIRAYCFHPDTYVLTEIGMIPIRELISLNNPPKVVSWNHALEKVELKEIIATSEHATNEDMFEIEYEGGTFRVTENHEVWSVTRNAYVKAKNLIEGEDILAVNPYLGSNL